MRPLAFSAALAAALVVASAGVTSLHEAEAYNGKRSYCYMFQNANYLLSLDFRTLREEVARRYEHAVDVFNSRSTIYSESPLFEWANQTKIACAKAIGYLRRHFIWRPEIDVESIQKCECFYDRMTAYLGHRRYSLNRSSPEHMRPGG
jgi:hypothetical protein